MQKLTCRNVCTLFCIAPNSKKSRFRRGILQLRIVRTLAISLVRFSPSRSVLPCRFNVFVKTRALCEHWKKMIRTCRGEGEYGV